MRRQARADNTTKVVVAEGNGAPRCGACGQEAAPAWGFYFLYPSAAALAGAWEEVTPLCAPCFNGKQEEEKSGTLAVWPARDLRATEAAREGGRAEERFGALLAAGRVFWRALEGGSPFKSDEIFPTLRLAHYVGDQLAGPIRYRGVRLKEVLEGVPILEQTPVRVSPPRAARHAPYRAYLEVQIGPHQGPHQRALEAEDIAAEYRSSLQAAGEPWGAKGAQITYGFDGDSLAVEVIRGQFSTVDDGSLWPSPPTVGRIVKGILEEFAGELRLRGRGPEMKRENLIPGTVAHLLRSTRLNNPFITKAGKTDRQEIQRLLEGHVFGVEARTIGPDRWRQIWRDADASVARMERLYYPPPMRYVVVPFHATRRAGEAKEPPN